MLMLYAVAGYLILGAVILYLIRSLTKAKEALFAARQEAVHAQARQDASRQAARTAEQRCVRALANLQQSLDHTGEALEIAEDIQVVSQQVHGLTEYITGPADIPPPVRRRPGRHALPGGGVDRPALGTGPVTGMEGEFIP
jgi:hypothetical protein